MLKRKILCVRGIAFALVAFALAAQADISYIAVPGTANSGYTEVGDPTTGQARIEYNYRLDESSGYWHYAYQVFNDDYNNNATPTDRDNDYHFGYEYDGDPLFVDAKAGDFRLRDDSPAHALGFEPIPFDKIGLRVDQYRKQLP